MFISTLTMWSYLATWANANHLCLPEVSQVCCKAHLQNLVGRSAQEVVLASRCSCRQCKLVCCTGWSWTAQGSERVGEGEGEEETGEKYFGAGVWQMDGVPDLARRERWGHDPAFMPDLSPIPYALLRSNLFCSAQIRSVPPPASDPSRPIGVFWVTQHKGKSFLLPCISEAVALILH